MGKQQKSKAFWAGEKLADLLQIEIVQLQKKYKNFTIKELAQARKLYRPLVEKENRQPKVLLYDIETSPNLGYVYGKYQQDVIQFEKEWDLLAFAFKWMGSRAVEGYAQDEYTEEELVYILHDLLDQADVVIAHNGDRFDQKMSNTKFLEYGLEPPQPYKSIDTLKVARKYFRFTSNRLGDLGEKLGVGSKVQLGGFAVWLACMNGDQAAWNKMKRYNKQDVKLLEEVYYKLRPWIDNHPPMNIYSGKEDGCPKCMGTRLHSRGTKVTKTAEYQRFQCQDCGGWSQARKGETKDVKYTN